MRSDGKNATLADVVGRVTTQVLGMIGRRIAGLSRSRAVGVDPEVLKTIRSYWASQGYSERTTRDLLHDAFFDATYPRASGLIRKHWGSLAGKRVLDLGCGWGSLSVLLARAGADLTFSDISPDRVEVTARRVPSARGLILDATRPENLPDEFRAKFDFVVANSLIEHVSPPPGHRGPAGPTLPAKAGLLETMSRCLAAGGRAFLSTGNYRFPIDGEIKVYFFHLLPPDEQQELLNVMGLQADVYGLLNWDEVEALLEDSGFEVAAVESCDSAGIEALTTVLTVVSFLSARGSWRLPRYLVERLRTLFLTDPRFMPAWFLFLRRAED